MEKMGVPGHDYLEAYLQRIGLTADEAFPLGQTGKLDGDNLQSCPGLANLPVMTDHYREASLRMVEQPRTGVG